MSVRVTDKVSRVSPPAEPGQRYCDACSGVARYRLEAKAGEYGTTRTMRLCYPCLVSMTIECTRAIATENGE